MWGGGVGGVGACVSVCVSEGSSGGVIVQGVWTKDEHTGMSV